MQPGILAGVLFSYIALQPWLVGCAPSPAAGSQQAGGKGRPAPAVQASSGPAGASSLAGDLQGGTGREPQPEGRPVPEAGRDAAGVASQEFPESPKAVRIVHPQPLPPNDSYPSSLYVEDDVKVTARRTGMIERVMLDRGAAVQKGQIMAVVETDASRQELDMAEQEERLAKAEYDRVHPLSLLNMVSSQELLRAETALSRASSKTALARTSLERCKVLAPFDGVILERWAVVGQRVTDDAGSPPLFRVAAQGPLRARVDLPEELIPTLALGARAFLEVSGETQRHPARIVFIGPAVDPASGTAPVIVEATGPDRSLRLGGAVQVRFEAARVARGTEFRVPLDAFPAGFPPVPAEGTLLVAENGRATPRPVRVLARDWSARVRGELSASDSVIVGAGASVEPGDPVRVSGEGP